MTPTTKIALLIFIGVPLLIIQLIVILIPSVPVTYMIVFPIIDVAGTLLNMTIYGVHTAIGSPRWVTGQARTSDDSYRPVKHDIHFRLAIVTLITLLSPIANSISCVYWLGSGESLTQLYEKHSAWFIYGFAWMVVLCITATIVIGGFAVTVIRDRIRASRKKEIIKKIETTTSGVTI